MGIFKPKVNKNIQYKINELNASVMIAVPHVNGLPFSENTLCQIYCCYDKLVISVNDINFNISFTDIQSMCISTDIDIQEQYVSSAGGAIAGAMILGPLGALVGGKVNQKTIRDIKKYLIITHCDEGEVKYYLFDVTYTPKSNDIIKVFNEKIE